jgi:CRISPR-associated protein Cmr6
MRQAAVPKRVSMIANEFRDAAPGHRFNLYFPIWTDDWRADSKGKKPALKSTTGIPKPVLDLLDALRRRQQLTAASFREHVAIQAYATSPFATGLGNEHPVENGFAFLTPYGLPYLAGSGVKGVLRRAAEEIALFPEDYRSDEAKDLGDFTMLDVWWLFGFEGAGGAWWPLTRKEDETLGDSQKEGRQRWRERFEKHCYRLVDRRDLSDFIKRGLSGNKESVRYLAEPEAFLRNLATLRSCIHTRGALDVWDVFPEPHGDRLTVEIMTPHYSDYYQCKTSPAYPRGATPHDAGQPNPIPFLAIPAGSQFEFHLICQVDRLPPRIADRWQTMVAAIFGHAFEWLGFGAKTAVGYGQIKEDLVARDARLAELQRAQADAQREADFAMLSPIERSVAEAIAAKADPGLTEGVYLLQLIESDRWQGDDVAKVAAMVRDKLKLEKKWKESSNKPDRDKDYKRTQKVLELLERS